MGESEETQEQPPEGSLLDSDFAPGWPDDVREGCNRLFGYDLAEVRGQSRLGALSFDQAPEIVEEIRSIVRDLALEPWADLPPSFTGGGLLGQLQELCETLDAMLELSSDSENPSARRDELNNRLSEVSNWFRQTARPLAVKAQIDRRLNERPDGLPSDAALRDLRHSYDDLARRAAEVNRELDARQEVLSQTRSEVRESAGDELSAVFRRRADDCRDAAKAWLVALIVSAPLAVAGAVGTFLLLRPDSGAKDAHDFAGLGLGLFILGVLAFGIRVCAQNYRVNRHLEALAKSKANAISTFQRLAASVEDDEIRSAVTLTLAQAIFAIDETGLVDGSADHVTLVERAVLPHLPGSGVGS